MRSNLGAMVAFVCAAILGIVAFAARPAFGEFPRPGAPPSPHMTTTTRP